MIKARIPPENPDANLRSYDKVYQSFSWSDLEKEFAWHETGEVNIVHEAIDRWADDEKQQNRKALVFEKADMVKEYTYLDLKGISSQWANLFIEHGLGAGDRMFILLPSCPEVYFAMLACARLGIIFYVLFPSLSYDEIEARLQNSKPRGIITHPEMAERLPVHAVTNVQHVFLTEEAGDALFPNETLVPGAVEDLPRRSLTRWVTLSTPLYLVYTTSGGTGPPKGVVHAHGDMVGHLWTARCVLDVKDDSVLWTDAGEPGWSVGIVYGAFAPWLCGATSVVQGDHFSASTWYRTLEKHRVTNWYTNPRTINGLMQGGDDLPGRYDLSALRHISTVGEILSPAQFYWARQALKLHPHDTWWMTESGMICLANFPSMSIRPGSMGKPVPGVEAAVLDDDGEPLPEFSMGELALKPGWPCMMTSIWEDQVRYQEYFRHKGWFLTGDMVTMDGDGYFFYHSRNDDLIKVGQQDTGPYEVEQVLALHQAVAESVVISVRATDREPTFKAFVKLREGFTPSKRLDLEVKSFVKAGFSPEIPLSEVVFLDELPKTLSGTPLHRVLLARELGLPIGDTRNLQE